MAGFGDIFKLMSHAKELQASAEALKKELPTLEFSASSLNGAISVTVGGDLTVRKIVIAPEVAGNAPLLETELQNALNSAIGSARLAMQERMKGVTDSLGIELPSF